MGRDKVGVWMGLDEPVERSDQLIERGELWSVKVPLRVTMEFVPAFVKAVEGPEKGHRVRRVDQHRDAQSAGLVPQGRDTRIVGHDQLALIIARLQPQLFEYLEPTCAGVHIGFQSGHRVLCPIRLANARPVHIAKAHKAPRISLVQGLEGPS